MAQEYYNYLQFTQIRNYLQKFVKRSKYCLAWLGPKKVNLKLFKLNNILRHFAEMCNTNIVFGY
jgi:hypothetical protein